MIATILPIERIFLIDKQHYINKNKAERATILPIERMLKNVV